MSRRRSRPRVAIAAATLAALVMAACSGDTDQPDAATTAPPVETSSTEATAAGATSQGRLFVRVTIETDDGTEQRTEVIDLDDGSVVAALPTGARIHPDAAGRIGILDESWSDGRLRFVDPGIEVVDGQVSKHGASVLSFDVASDEVLNVDIGTKFVGVFSESGSVARFINTSPLPASAPAVVEIDRNDGLSMIDEEGMGGQALPWGDEFLVSIVSEGEPPFPAGPMPVGVQRFDADGEPREEFDCSGLGFGSAGDVAVLACSDGLLVLDRSDDTVSSGSIGYPDETASCFQIQGGADVGGFVVSCSDANTFEPLDLYFLSLDDRQLTVIDGTAGRWTTHLAGTGDDVRIAYLERATGDLVVRSLPAGTELGRASGVVAPFPAFPVSWSTVSGNKMYVGFVAANANDADAVNAVIEVDLTSGTPTVERRFELPGAPGRIEVLGAVS